MATALAHRYGKRSTTQQVAWLRPVGVQRGLLAIGPPAHPLSWRWLSLAEVRACRARCTGQRRSTGVSDGRCGSRSWAGS